MQRSTVAKAIAANGNAVVEATEVLGPVPVPVPRAGATYPDALRDAAVLVVFVGAATSPVTTAPFTVTGMPALTAAAIFVSIAAACVSGTCRPATAVGAHRVRGGQAGQAVQAVQAARAVHADRPYRPHRPYVQAGRPCRPYRPYRQAARAITSISKSTTTEPFFTALILTRLAGTPAAVAVAALKPALKSSRAGEGGIGAPAACGRARR